MTQGQIAARITGDDYQGRFFWCQALQLLIPCSNVSKVILEHDKASGFDDVVVFYDPPIKGDGGSPCAADYFQLKYHMNQDDVYSSESVRTKKRDDGSTLFEKLYRGFKEIAPGNEVRLSLVSNVCWSSADPISKCIRHDGRLSDEFFNKGTSSAVGKCRTELLEHLAANATLACDQKSFLAFARSLRLRMPHMNVSDLLKMMNAHAIAAGLKPLDTTVSNVVLDDLYRKLVQQGRTEFTKDSLLTLCKEEKLMGDGSQVNRTSLGVRSFMRFAENMERDSEQFECLCDLFDGRYIRDAANWKTAYQRLQDFFQKAKLSDQREYELLLETHLTFAYACGAILDRKSGAKVYPVQKGRDGRITWKPGAEKTPVLDTSRWEFSSQPKDPAGTVIVLALSVTHPVASEAEKTLAELSIKPVHVLAVSPKGGPSASSISGADEALSLAEEIQKRLVALRKEYPTASDLHIFASAPSGLAFFLGQVGAALKPVQLYEYGFDYDETRWHKYEPSLKL